MDFSFDSHLLTFQPGEMMATVEITILDDSILEQTEFFNLLLEVPQTSVDRKVTAGKPAEATVNILDNDSAFSAVAVPSKHL